MAVPIKVEDRVIGVISLEHPEYHAFEKEHEHALEALAGYAAIAIENTKLIAELARNEKENADLVEEWIRAKGFSAGQFFYFEIAHDVKNLLAHLKVALENLSKSSAMRKLTQRQERGIKGLIDRVEQNADTIQNYLEIAGNLEEELEYYDLNTLVGQSLRLSQNRISEYEIDVDTSELAEKLPPVRVNRMQIIMVLFNLIDNAIDAMAKMDRARMLRIQTRLSKDKKWIETVIKDNGTGISRENMRKLFRPYFSTKKKKGRGLGLFGSRRITEAHGGSLQNPDSRFGKGTTFHILLPVHG